MKKINKIMSFALALSLTASTAAGTVASYADYDEPTVAAADKAEATYTEGEFTVTESGALSGYSGAGGDVVIPSTVSGITVTSINGNVFKGSEALTGVTIPDTVTAVNYYTSWFSDYGAFENCSNLTSVTLGNGLKGIEKCTFENCKKLTNVTIPDSVEYIDDYAFKNCSALTAITIGKNVKTIGKEAFYGCSKAEDIVVSDAVETIDESAFYGCSYLANLTLGKSVKSIGTYAFKNCSKLMSIKIPDSVETISKEAFNGCTSAASLTLGSGLKTIGDSAFYNCSAILRANIPNSVTSIGSSAFYGCSKLVKVTLPSTLETINNKTFYDCKVIDGIVIPDTVTSIGDSAFYGCAAMATLTMGKNVESIGNYAFRGCGSFKEVTLPATLTVLGEQSFYNCANLTSIAIPAGVGTISASAFAGCNALASATISDGVRVIGGYAFSKTSVKSISIPDSVYKIEEYAFNDCKSLTDVSIGSGMNSITKNPFWYSTNITTVSLDKVLESVGNDVFKNCSKIADIYYTGTKAEWNEFIEMNGSAYLVSIKDNYTVHCKDGDEVGKNAVTKTVKSITVTAPTKLDYKLGDELDLSGGSITINWSNNTTSNIPITKDMVSGFNNAKTGTQTITVTYESKNGTFKVTVTDGTEPVVSVDSITVSTKPTKTQYNIGEALDVTGGMITVKYTGGKADEPIALTAAMCTGFDSTTAGIKTITVTYEGKTTTFTVKVSDGSEPSEDEGVVLAVGENETFKTIDDAVAQITKDSKTKNALQKLYTIKLSGNASAKKAISLPKTTVAIKADSAAELTVASIGSKGSLILENLTLKASKGTKVPAVTAKGSLIATSCTFGAAKAASTTLTDCTISGALTLSDKKAASIIESSTVTGKISVKASLLLDKCKTGAVTAKGDVSVVGGELQALTVSVKTGNTLLVQDAKILKNLTVSNDLTIEGNCEVGGKFTAKAAVSINGFKVKNGK